MDYEQAVTELAGLFDRVQATVPGDGEWQQTQFGARPCEGGAQSMLQRLGPGSDDPEAAAAAIVAVLDDAGYPARAAVTGTDPLVIEGSYPAEGTDGDGLGIQFGVSANATTLMGLTRCVPGDPAEINEQHRQ